MMHVQQSKSSRSGPEPCFRTVEKDHSAVATLRPGTDERFYTARFAIWGRAPVSVLKILIIFFFGKNGLFPEFREDRLTYQF